MYFTQADSVLPGAENRFCYKAYWTIEHTKWCSHISYAIRQKKINNYQKVPKHLVTNAGNDYIKFKVAKDRLIGEI